MTEVAVVIPAYNAERTLGETLESLLSQTFQDFEAIVVDDGSTDGTRETAERVSDPRVRVLSIPNGGVANARNRGIAATESELVAFLDADDLWRPEKLSRQVTALRNTPEACLCVTGAVRIDAASRELEAMPLEHPKDPVVALLLHSMIVGCLSSGVARRSALEQIGGFDPRFSQSADWDLWLRLALAGQILIVDEPLVRYRSAPGNMSSDVTLLERDTFAVLDAFFARSGAARYLALRERVYAAHWLVCAGSYLHAGRRIDAVRCLTRAVRTNPASVTRALGLPARALRRRLAGARGAA